MERNENMCLESPSSLSENHSTITSLHLQVNSSVPDEKESCSSLLVKLCVCDVWAAAKSSVWIHNTSGCGEGLWMWKDTAYIWRRVWGEAACQKVQTNPTHYSHLTCLGTYSSPGYVQLRAEVTLCTASVKNSKSPGRRAESTRDVRADWGQEERLHIHTAQQAAQLRLLCSSQASWLALPQLPYGITIAFNLLCVLSHLGLNGCLVYPSTEVWTSLLHWLFFLLLCVCVCPDNHSDDQQYPVCVLPAAREAEKVVLIITMIISGCTRAHTYLNKLPHRHSKVM